MNFFPRVRRKRNRKSSQSTRPRRFSTFVERLEARNLLATLLVNSTADGLDLHPGDGTCDDGGGVCTLRGAIIEANALPGPDTISLPAGTYALTLAGTHEDFAFTGDLDITDDLTIAGAGSGNTVIDAAGLDRVFHIPQIFAPTSVSSVTLDALTIQGGLATDAGGPGSFFSAASGGGIFNEVFGNSITLSNSVVTDNTALGSAVLTSGDAQGGGIADIGGNWTISSSEIVHNDAVAVASLFLAGTGRGGGIYAEYTTTNLLIDTTVSNNEAVGGSDDGFVGAGAGQGGGIFGSYGTWTMVGSTTVDSNQARGGLGIVSPGGAGEGGGIYSEGSFWNFSLSPGSSISRNAAIGGDGGFAGGAAAGGGIYSAYDSWFDPFTFAPIANNTISGNTAAGGNADPGSGGGGSALGGGIFALGSILAEHLTIADNDATGGSGAFAGAGEGGGIYNGALGVNLKSTIVADNTASTLNPDVSGFFSSYGYNLIGDVGTASGFGMPGDQLGTAAAPIDPVLGPLQNNGGPTETHELLAGSPAIDAADPFSLVVTDQRGVGRPIDGDLDTIGINDVGAYEATAPVAGPAIAIETLTNGIDADDPIGPRIGAGGAASFTYIVTNPGGVALSNVVVTDSQGVVVSFVGGDANSNTLLDPGETWTYHASTTVTAGQYMNTGTVTADDPLLMPISDMDDSHHFGVVLGIDIETSTDGLDADAPTGPTILEGGTAGFTYTVTNTGNVALENVAVSDSQGVAVTYQGGDTDLDNELDVSETWIYAGSTIVTAGQYMNTGTAVGDDATDTIPGQIMAGDDSHHFGAVPQIAIEKLVSVDGGATFVDADAATGPALVQSGAAPEFRYEVTLGTGAGAVALSNVVVSDSDLGTITGPAGGDDGDGILEAGETWVYSAAGTWSVGQNSSTASADGDFTDSQASTAAAPTAADDANYFGAVPQIAIETLVSVDGGGTFVDADAPAGPALVQSGAAPEFRYEVTLGTGAGAVDVSNVAVSDSVLGAIAGPASGDDGDGVLEAGETWIYLATGTWSAGQNTSSGSADGDFTDDGGATEVSATATDQANYFGAVAGIDLETLVSVDGGATFVDANDAPGPNMFQGAALDPQFRFVLTNAGNVGLSNVSLTDTDFGTLIPPAPGVAGGDLDDDGVLDTNETWTVELTGTFALGQHTNTGTASGDFTDDGGNFEQPSGVDDANYFGAAVSIDIERLTNGVDQAVVSPGDSVIYSYDVTNPGSVPLSNITVVDDNGTPSYPGDDFNPAPVLDVTLTYNVGDLNFDNKLDTTETWHYVQNSTAADLGVSIDFETDGQGLPLAAGTVIDDEYQQFGLTVSGGATILDSSFATPDQSGLVALIEFNETSGTIAADTSGQGNNNFGTLDPLVGSPTWTGGTLDFDGVDDRVLMAASSDINLLDVAQRSIYVRFKADNAAGGKQVLYEEGSTIRGLNIYLDSGQLYVGGWNLPGGGESAWAGTYLNTPVTSGVWHEAVLVLNAGLTVGPDALKGYLDGTLFGSGSGSQVWAHSGAIGIGGTNGQTIFHDGVSLSDNHFFDGEIDELRISNPAGLDLATPNQDFGGPGVGAGGSAGQLGENRNPQQNVLLLDTGTITFDFDTPVRVNNIGLLDVDDPGATIELYDSSATLIGTPIPIAALGDNSFQIVVLNTESVAQLKIIAPGEKFAVTALDYDLTSTSVGTASGQFNPTVVASDESSLSNPLVASVHIEKSTQGADADSPTGPVLLSGPGTQADFEYVVTNTGQLPLEPSTFDRSMFVVDDNGTPGDPGDDYHATYISGDVNNNGILELDETWIYQASLAPITPGQYTNVGSVEAVDAFGQITTPITAEDPSNHFGADPQIDIEKLVSVDGGATFADADSATGPSLLQTGAAPEFRYEVTLGTGSGSVALSNVTVTDSVLGTIAGPDSGDDGDGILEAGETWIYAATGTWSAGQNTNTATATGDFTDDESNFRQASDTDNANYFGAVTGIHIEKATEGVDADTPTGPLLPVGTTANFTYVVTNTGNVALSNVVVTDDQGVTVTYQSGDANLNNMLDLNETWTYTANTTVTAGQYGNTGTATGDFTDGAGGFEQPSDFDLSHHFGIDAQIDIEKSTEGLDADTPTGPILAVGDTAHFSYVVTNTGNVALSNVAVTDDNGTPGVGDDFSPTFVGGDTNTNNQLDLGETWTYTASTTVTGGQYANTATASGEDVTGTVASPAMDTDASHHYGVGDNPITCNPTQDYSALIITAADSSAFPTATVAGGYFQTFPTGAEDFAVTFDHAFIPAGQMLNPDWAGNATFSYTMLDSNVTSDAFQAVGDRVTEYHDFNPGDIPNRSGREFNVFGRGHFTYNGSPGALNHAWQVTYDFSSLVNGYLPAGTILGFSDIDGVAVANESVLLAATLASGGSNSWLAYEDDAPNPEPGHGLAAYDALNNTYLFDGPNASNDHIAYVTSENLTQVTISITQTMAGSSLGMKFAAPLVSSCIEGTVRNDTADDNTLDGDEPGIPGVLVALFTDPNGDGDPTDGTEIGSTVTATDGTYAFPNQPAGDYVIVEFDPAGAVSDDDSQGPPTDNLVAITIDGVLPSVGNDFLDDFPGDSLHSISGSVFDDADASNDNLFGPDDEPIGGVLLTLYRDANGNGVGEAGELVATTRTDFDGAYSFGGLTDGNYLVVESDPFGAVSENDAEGDPLDNLVAVALVGADSGGNDFLDDGTTPYTISGQVRIDVDVDGDLNDPDAGLAGVTVSLFTDPNGDGDPGDGVLVDQVLTSAGGNYQFSVLSPGDYVVVETDLAGYISTADSDLPNDNRIGVNLPVGVNSSFNDFLDVVVVAAVDIEKATEGQDADSPTGPLLPVGDTADFTYVVTNTGNVALANVAVTDDQGVTVTYQSGDTDGDNELDVTETWIFTASTTVTAGQYTNIGTVSAVDTTGTIPGIIGDADASNHFGVVVGIDIEKATEGQDADSPTGPLLPVGDTADFTYVVTNTGNMALSNVVVTDDQGVTVTYQSGDSDADNQLDVTETWTYIGSVTVTAGQYAGTATATAQDATGTVTGTVDDDDLSHHFGVVVGIDIEKSTAGQDADTGPGPLLGIGTAANFEYTVTNTGNVALSNVEVTDDQGVTVTYQSGDTDSDNELDVAETWIYTGSSTVTAGQYVNVGTATADDATGTIPGQVSDNDSSHHYGGTADIEIEKYVGTSQVGSMFTIDFDTDANGNPIAAGATIDDEYVAWGVKIAAENARVPGAGNRAMIFDSANPTGGDTDLGTPNVDFAGPGIGTGGDAAGAGPNMNALGNILIVSEDGDASDPDDELEGGTIKIGWDTPVTLDHIGLLGVQVGGSDVTVYQASGATTVINIPILGTNAFQEITIGLNDVAGIVVHLAGPGAVTEVKFSEPTDLGDPADTPSGPLYEIGDTVNFAYVVTNPGDVELSAVVVVDDNATPGNAGDDFNPSYVSGDDDGDGRLDPNETWYYEASIVTTSGGQFTNIGEASGTPVSPAGTPLDSPVVADDPGNYFVVDGGIQIETATEGQDADSPTGPWLAVGDTADFTYVVTNTGNVALANVVVTDNQGVPVTFVGGDTDSDNQLDLTETWTYTASTTVTAGQYANIGTATAVDATGTAAGSISDDDPSHHFGVDARIDIETATEGQDADSPTGPNLLIGSTVTFTYVITNIGNVDFDINDIVVTDSVLGAITNLVDQGDGDSLLEVGESWQYQATAIVSLGQYANTGSVTADFTDYANVTYQAVDQDDSHHLGKEPVPTSIHIEKFTNGVNADDPADAPEILAGSNVTWTYEVTVSGFGAVSAGEIEIVDDAGTPGNTGDDFSISSGDIVLVGGDDGDGQLEVGETWVYEATGIAQLLSTTGGSTTFTTTGSSGTDGSNGNIRTFSSGGISLNASAFSRDAGGTWEDAFLGAYSSGLGVTDNSEGSGGDGTHRVDNIGEVNYVLFAFSENVIVDRAYLDSVVTDSDLSVWIGTIPNAFTNPVTLSDSVLAGLNVNEVNDTTSSSARWADINSGEVAGNVLVLAASVADSTPEDQFKIENLDVQSAGTGIYENIAVVTAEGLTDDDLSHYTPLIPNPSIDIEKFTNGVNADSAAEAPELWPGDVVTWTYEVANTGNVPYTLAEIEIVDDAGTPGDSGDDFSIASGGIVLDTGSDAGSDGILSPGETWIFAASGIAQELTTTGNSTTFTMTGSTSTDGSDGNIRAFDSGGISVNASAFSRSSGGTWDEAFLGAYSSGLGVTDSSEGSGGNGTHRVDNLDRGNYVLFAFSENVIVDRAFLDSVVNDSDLSVWIGTIPGAFTSPVMLSDAVLAGLVVNETNDTTSSYSRWADINSGEVAGNVLVLAASVTTSTPNDQFKIEYLDVREAGVGVYNNIAVVTAGDATDQDQSHYTNAVPNPGIDIEKSTNGVDADQPTGPIVNIGETVDFSYTITNTGNVPLSNVTVSDDNGTPGNAGDDFSPTFTGGDNGNGLLDPGEVWTYAATTTASAGQYAGTSVVDGTDDQGTNVSDMDLSHYVGVSPFPSIDIQHLVAKQGSTPEDADTPTGPIATVGETIVFTYVLSNNGNTPLTNVQVTDSVLGTVTNIVDQGNGDNILDILESWTLTATFATTSAEEGQQMNLGTVTTAQWAGDSDPAYYFVRGAKFFVPDMDDDATYRYGESGQDLGDFNLQSLNKDARGATALSDGSKLWVLDKNRDQNVFVYDGDGNALGAWQAKKTSYENDRLPDKVNGIATDDTSIWIVEQDKDQVYFYNGGASFVSGSHNATSKFALNSNNDHATGITTDGASIWVVDEDGSNSRVYKYTVSGSYLGSWAIDGNNRKPRGITIDPSGGTSIWIVDQDADKIFQYDNATGKTSGSKSADFAYALDPNSDKPEGIADPPPRIGGRIGQQATGLESSPASALPKIDAARSIDLFARFARIERQETLPTEARSRVADEPLATGRPDFARRDQLWQELARRQQRVLAADAPQAFEYAEENPFFNADRPESVDSLFGEIGAADADALVPMWDVE